MENQLMNDLTVYNTLPQTVKNLNVCIDEIIKDIETNSVNIVNISIQLSELTSNGIFFNKIIEYK